MAQHKILIIGVGSIGERHTRCFQSTNRAQIRICEPNETLRKTIAERYHLQHVYASLDEALVDPPTAAVVATPAQTHIAISQRLAEQGIHLLIEKPLSTSIEGTETLIQTVKKQKLTAAVAYVHRANPALAALRQLVQSGRFGKPVEATFITGQHFPTYRPAYREIYYTRHETGGGAIQDALTHILNAGEWILGPLDRLMGDAQHLALPGVTVEDSVHVIARHGPVMAAYTLNQHQAPNELVFTIMCEQGTVRFEYPTRVRWMTNPATQQWQQQEYESLERDTVFTNQANAFIDAIEGKSPPLCTLEEGLHTLKLNLALLKEVQSPPWTVI
ncbi:MAG: Gfo/Idh/MocA family oxidoreductase [Phycisphaerales bacterium]|jgi:predicted dehydrogenase|nr:Gfo/Idh/MocA family oxidoreductase [Phycisphaerales bacterium]